MNNLYSDHIIHGSPKLHKLISIFFSSIIVHGYCPPEMMYGEMVPVPKVTGSSNSDDFRAITLGSIIAKLLDIILLNFCQETLQTCNLQFGFKKGSSTACCTFVLQEAVSYYNKYESNVYVTLLDASKAFDRLEFCSLFKKLLKTEICPLILRILLFIYTNQFLAVRWNNARSCGFKTSNRVKQGGVISPSIFCLCIDDLLKQLGSSGYGCHIGPFFCGTLGYADDIALLSPTANGMNKMLGVCSVYAETHNILLNTNKTKVIFFPHKRKSLPNAKLYLNGKELLFVNHAKHLGHMIINNTPGTLDVTHIGACFNKAVNIMLANFGNISSLVLCKIFNQYCSNLYGISLCDVSSKQYSQLCVLWRKAIRKVLSVPGRTYNNLLPLISGIQSLNEIVFCRITKFYLSMCNSENIILKCVARRCLFQSTSNMGKNINIIDRYVKLNNSLYNLSLTVILGELRKNLTQVLNDDKLMFNAEICKELINIRDGLCISPLSFSECQELLEVICTE